MKRLEKIYNKIKNKCDSLLLINDSDFPDMNVQYYSGLNCLDVDGTLYWKFDKEPLLLLSDPYQKTEIKYMIQTKKKDDIYEIMEEYGKIQKIGFNGERVTVDIIKKFQDKLPTMRFIDISNELREMRAVKEKKELDEIKKACNLTKKAFKEVRNFVGKKEIDIAMKIDGLYYKNGAMSSFRTIVASGKNSLNIHASPTLKKIGKKETVIVDTGCRMNGYCGDMTKTFISNPNQKQKEMMKLVEKALEVAMENTKPGMQAEHLYLKIKNFFGDKAKYWLYGLGHGIGLDVHEYPTISLGSDDILKSGMVITLEPGLSIPTIGGSRIEYTGIVTSRGFKPL